MRILLPAVLLALLAAPADGADFTDPEQLAALVADPAAVYLLVDVRSAGEYRSGHIPTAINIPVTEIATAPPTTDTDALIIVYCGSGMRSARAATALQDLGYTRVVDFGAVGRWPGPLAEDTDEKGDSP